MKRVIASIAVLACTVPAAGFAAESLGRLFFTPAQRANLDAGKAESMKKAPAKPPPRMVRLDGVVTRSDAERTVWINGRPYHNDSPEGLQVGVNPGTPGSTSILVPGKAGARVKVGQNVDLNSGRVSDNGSRDEAAPGETTPAEAAGDAKPAPQDGTGVAVKPGKPAGPPAAAR